MTTKWQIFNTEYQVTDGLIVKVVYGCTVEQDMFIDRTIKELKLTGSPSTEGFVPYQDLTEATVLAWVKASLGEAQVSEIETTLQNSVAANKAAKDAETQKSGLPWIK